MMLLIVFFFILGSSGLELNRTYNLNDKTYGNSIICTTSGAYAIVGSTYKDSYNLWAILISPDGTPIWNYTLGGSSYDEGYSIVETASRFAIAGKTKSFSSGNYDLWVVMLGKDGNLIYQKSFGGPNEDVGMKIVKAKSDGFVIAGYTYSYGSGSSDAWLIGISSDGDIIWNQTYGGESTDKSFGLTATSNRDYAFTGYTESYGAGSEDLWIVRVDSTGKIVWNITIGGSSQDIGTDIIECSDDDGLAVTGYTKSYGGSSTNLWAIKVTSSGTLRWRRTIGGSLSDYGYSLVQTPDYGFVMTGYTKSYSDSSGDLWVVKLNKNGGSVWKQTFGGKWLDVGNSIALTPDGAFAVVGYTQSYGERTNYPRMWLLTINCTKGSYLSSQGCSSCREGTYSTDTNSDTCTSCPIGSFAAEANSSSCSLCPKGTYSAKKGSAKCNECPVNTYSKYLGATSLEDCLDCSVGTYSYKSSSSCMNCSYLGIKGENGGPYFVLPSNNSTVKCYFNKCPAGLGIDTTENLLCLPCNERCLECTYAYSASSCKSCRSEYKFFSGRCVDKVPSWFWPIIGTALGIAILLVIYAAYRVCPRSCRKNDETSIPDKKDQETTHSVLESHLQPPTSAPNLRSFQPPQHIYKPPVKLPPILINHSPRLPLAPPISVQPKQEIEDMKVKSIAPQPKQEIEDMKVEPEAEEMKVEPEDEEMKVEPNYSLEEKKEVKLEPMLPFGEVPDDPNLQICVVCFDKKREIAFFPCGHLVACRECSEKLTKCPLDQIPIEERRKVYTP